MGKTNNNLVKEKTLIVEPNQVEQDDGIEDDFIEAPNIQEDDTPPYQNFNT